MRLERRNTPYGPVLVAVEDDSPDLEDHIEGVAIHGEPASNLRTPVQSSATSQAAVGKTVRSVLRRLVPRAAREPDPTVTRLRQETRAAMDRADVLVDDLFAEYLRQVEDARTNEQMEADNASDEKTSKEVIND